MTPREPSGRRPRNGPPGPPSQTRWARTKGAPEEKKCFIRDLSADPPPFLIIHEQGRKAASHSKRNDACDMFTFRNCEHKEERSNDVAKGKHKQSTFCVYLYKLRHNSIDDYEESRKLRDRIQNKSSGASKEQHNAGERRHVFLCLLVGKE